MQSPTDHEPRYVPDWIRDLFTRYLKHQEQLGQVLRMSVGGISMLRERHELVKALAELYERLEESQEEIKQAEQDRDLAQREIENDFPLLHEQATIALWSSLEALVLSFVAQWLSNTPGAWQCEAIKKLRVKLGDYEALAQSERCLWVVDLLDQEVSGPLRNGVNRFECLLQPFGLDGNVEADCQKALFELSQIRHVLVHRNGETDKKLLDACPWLQLSVGQRLKIDHKMWRTYNSAVAEYTTELIERVRVRLGGKRSKEIKYGESPPQ